MPPRSRVPRGTPASGAPLGRAGKGPRGRDRCTGEPIRLVTPRVYFSGIFAPYLVSCRESQSGLTVRGQRGSLPFSRLGDEGYFPKSFVNGDLFFPCFSECFGGSRGDGLGAIGDWSLLSTSRVHTEHPRRLPTGHGLDGSLRTSKSRGKGRSHCGHRLRGTAVPSAGGATATRTAKKNHPEKQRNKISEGITKAFFSAGKENALPALHSRCLSHRPLAPG